jgi:hypothetical protein
MPSRRLATAVAVLAASGGLAACGNKEDRPTFGSTEGVYVNVGQLQYQVQVSRQLNPNNIEDRGYLVGLTPQQRHLAPNEIFFAVFMRVENAGKDQKLTANQFNIKDTQEHTYFPLPPAKGNVFAYRPIVIPHDGVNPAVGSPASTGPTQGSVLLFKIPQGSLDNRPLQLNISKPGEHPPAAHVDLDV